MALHRQEPVSYTHLSKTITTVTRGAFTEDKELQKMFLSMVKG